MRRKIVKVVSLLLCMTLVLCGCGGTNSGDSSTGQSVGVSNKTQKDLGASSAEEALELFWKAVNNQDTELAKQISLSYYVQFELTGRENLSNPTWNEYLNIYFDDSETSHTTQDEIDGVVRWYQLYGETPSETEVESSSTLQHVADYASDDFGSSFMVQSGYRYVFSDWDANKIHFSLSVLKINEKWFVNYDLYGNNYKLTGKNNYTYN